MIFLIISFLLNKYLFTVSKYLLTSIQRNIKANIDSNSLN